MHKGLESAEPISLFLCQLEGVNGSVRARVAARQNRASAAAILKSRLVSAVTRKLNGTIRAGSGLDTLPRVSVSTRVCQTLFKTGPTDAACAGQVRMGKGARRTSDADRHSLHLQMQVIAGRVC